MSDTLATDFELIFFGRKHYKNVPFGKIAAGGRDRRETADGTNGIAERESDGTGEAG
jgi:hypothetical protein